MSTKSEPSQFPMTYEPENQSQDAGVSCSTAPRKASKTAGRGPLADPIEQRGALAADANSDPGGQQRAVSTGERDKGLLDQIQATWRSLTSAVARLPERAVHSGFVLNVKAAFRDTSSRKRAVVGLSVVLLVVAFLWLFMTRGSAALGGAEQQAVTQWLDAQVAGGTGKEFVAPHANFANLHFHSLRSWRILDNPRPGQFLLELRTGPSDDSPATTECRVTVASVGQSTGGSAFKIIRLDFEPSSALVK